MRTCHFCDKKCSEAFCFCIRCAKEHELYGKPPKEWPKAFRLLKRILDLEHYHDRQFSEFIVNATADEEHDYLSEPQYQKFILERATPKELDMDEVLETYGITEAEYELMTGNLKELAEQLGISYQAISGRRSRLRRELKNKLGVPVTKVICESCGEEKKHHAKGLCRKCYMSKWQNENKERL